MLRLLRRLLRNSPRPASEPPTNSHATAWPPLSPALVRGRTFLNARRGRPGFDAEEVRTFLQRTADDLAAALTELAWVREENDRIKHALRQWQSTQWRRGQWQGDQPRMPARAPWAEAPPSALPPRSAARL